MSTSLAEGSAVDISDVELKYWWNDQLHLVDPTDEALQVIQPDSSCAPDELQAIGLCLQEWRDQFPGAKHIWGLNELLNSQWPRTPPDYLHVPFDLLRLDSAEPVAVVLVVKGTNRPDAVASLSKALEAFGSRLAWLTDVMAYSQFHR